MYWPALRNGFVWDDTALVLRDPLIRSWRLIPEGFGHFLFVDATAANFYRPLQRLTFTWDYACFGFGAPWGWHLTSILVHAGAAVALYQFARRLLPKQPGLALLGATLWAIHPLHTSAVTYVAGRADPLAALCGFTGLALGLASLPATRPLLFQLGAAAAFLGALLSKESGIFALLIWFLILCWRRVGWRMLGQWAAIASAVLGLYLGLRFTAEKNPPPPAPATSITVRPILAVRAVAEYAGLAALPLNLRMERDVSSTNQDTPEATRSYAVRREYQGLLGVLLILGLFAWGRWAARQIPDAALCLAAAIVAYLPISNLFSLNATVAEHWLYIPSAFLFLALAQTGQALAVGKFRLPLQVACAAWMLFLGVRTWIAQADWKDPRTFFERTIAVGGDTARIHINLGNVESNAGRHDAAIQHFQTAVQTSPTQPFAWLGLANAAIRARQFDLARSALSKIPESPRWTPEVLQARAVLEHLETGRDTTDLIRQASDIVPNNWPLKKRYLELLDEHGQTAEAARQLKLFLEAAPYRAESWRLLGTWLEKLNHPTAAATAYEQAAQRDVRDTFSRERLTALAGR